MRSRLTIVTVIILQKEERLNEVNDLKTNANERKRLSIRRKATVLKVQLRQLKQNEYKMGLARLWLKCQDWL
jgi:hypothetical protein